MGSGKHDNELLGFLKSLEFHNCLKYSLLSVSDCSVGLVSLMCFIWYVMYLWVHKRERVIFSIWMTISFSNKIVLYGVNWIDKFSFQSCVNWDIKWRTHFKFFHKLLYLLGSVCLTRRDEMSFYPWTYLKLKNSGQTLMKFYMNITPLKATQNLQNSDSSSLHIKFQKVN